MELIGYCISTAAVFSIINLYLTFRDDGAKTYLKLKAEKYCNKKRENHRDYKKKLKEAMQEFQTYISDAEESRKSNMEVFLSKIYYFISLYVISCFVALIVIQYCSYIEKFTQAIDITFIIILFCAIIYSLYKIYRIDNKLKNTLDDVFDNANRSINKDIDNLI